MPSAGIPNPSADRDGPVPVPRWAKDNEPGAGRGPPENTVPAGLFRLWPPHVRKRSWPRGDTGYAVAFGGSFEVAIPSGSVFVPALRFQACKQPIRLHHQVLFVPRRDEIHHASKARASACSTRVLRQISSKALPASGLPEPVFRCGTDLVKQEVDGREYIFNRLPICFPGGRSNETWLSRKPG